MRNLIANEQSRESPWRQGLVLEHQAALELIPSIDNPEQAIVVIATHDCDIASTTEREPSIEVIVGRRIATLGADTHAKTARRLHIEFQTANGAVPIELIATNKMPLSKIAVLLSKPRIDWQLTPEGLVTLQQWLAARYRRSAFADEFEIRLKAKPARLDRKIAKLLDEPSAHVLAVFFDIDDGLEKHRSGSDDVYQLRIILLYDGSKDEATAFAASDMAANAIEDAFEKAFSQGGAWKNIQLLSCMSISDNAMTVAESRLLKQWRLDYMSLEDDPQQPMFES